MTDCVVVPPAEVAVQVKVLPSVSVVTADASQPVVAPTAELASVTDQEIWTSLLYQPLVPNVPDTLGETVGAGGRC